LKSSASGWHVDQWPPLAWLETGLKGVAIAIGIAALLDVIGSPLALPGGRSLIQWIVLGILSVGLLAAILDRLANREIVAMLFVLLNNLGHWGMLVAIASSANRYSRWLVIFCGFMLAGDLVKLWFLRTSGFSVRDLPGWLLYALTTFYAVGYLIILLIG
jgi:hypothetical protein